MNIRSLTRPLAAWCALVLVAGVTVPAAAQAPPAGQTPRAITLAEALTLAAQNNLTLKVAVFESQVAQGQLVREEVRLYLRDVHDHVLRINDTIDSMRDMLGTALSVNLSLVTVAQGETVKRLGAWAALLAAPTLITSWYGMNFAHMPELEPRVAYPLLVLAVAAVCIVLYRLFKRARWL